MNREDDVVAQFGTDLVTMVLLCEEARQSLGGHIRFNGFRVNPGAREVDGAFVQIRGEDLNLDGFPMPGL